MAFKTHISESVEELAARLCKALAAPSSESAFNKDYIVVQSRGMEQWLKYQIAKHNGICSMCEFPFPETFLNMFFNDPAGAEQIPFRREVMTWAIFEVLPELVTADSENGRNLFSNVKNYLDAGKNDSFEIRLLQLSEKLSGIFYKYIAYRPECLLFWEGNSELKSSLHKAFQEDSWQRELWKTISAKLGGRHLPRLAYEAIIKGKNNFINTVPIKRASIFGISSLPPFYLDILTELSKYIDIHFFYRNICRENWEFNLSEKEKLRFFKSPEIDEMSGQQGNELLASMALKEREFFSILLSKDLLDDFPDEEETEEDPNQNDMLNLIRNDIMSMKEPETPYQAELNDDSIQIHSFHSPMREVESLHHSLVKFMDASKRSIKPEDIIVMTPDIQKYAPFIEAVFKSDRNKDRYIRSTISDRHIKEINAEAETFLKLLQTAKSRFKVTEVLSILSLKSVYSRFGLKTEDLELIKKWLKECSVNWGKDSSNRNEVLENNCSFSENSWLAGLNRMFLGYAMSPDPDNKINSLYRAGESSYIMPYEEIEGSAALVLGRFSNFIAELFAFSERLSSDLKTEEWKRRLLNAVDTFFEESADNEDMLDSLRSSIYSMFSNAELGGFDGFMGIETILAYLENHFEEKYPSLHFLRGGVTFCRFTPMRSIPAKVICMIGMDEDLFPMRDSDMEFDLMKHNRKNGDPSQKSECRYMFLEALLSAKEKLYISYIGKSITDNSIKLPSVLISELREYIDRNFIYPIESNEGAAGRTSDAIFLEHPLHSFSSSYFTDSLTPSKIAKLINYSSSDYRIAGMLSSRQTENKPFILDFTTPLPPMEETAVTLDNLVNFFINTSKYLLKNRLGINLEEALENELRDEELIDIESLEDYSLNQEILNLSETAGTVTNILDEKCLSCLNASGFIPPGKFGKIRAAENIPDVLKFRKFVDGYITGKSENFNSLISLSTGIKLSMNFTNLYQTGQIFFRLATEKVKDIIKTWIYHLGLCATNYTGTKETLFISKGNSCARFIPVRQEEALKILQELADIFFSGQRAPLPFFPETSYAYFKSFSSKKDHAHAIKSALFTFQSSYNHKGESDDTYINACFGDEIPDEELFAEYANNFFLTLSEYIVRSQDEKN